MNAKELTKMQIPEFLAEGWINYLRKCSECISQKEHGYRKLRRKLRKAGYAVGKDGTVYPF